MQITVVLSKHIRLTLLVLATAVLVACGSGENDQAKVESARAYMDQNQLRAAMIELKNALQINPENAQARYLLGSLSLRTGDMLSARKEFQRALEAGWKPEEAVIGKLRAMNGIMEYKEVLAADYDTEGWPVTAQADLLALKALAHAGLNDPLAAKNLLLSAEKLDKSAFDVLRTTILLQLSEGHLDEAEKTLTLALSRYPKSSDLMLIKARMIASDEQNPNAAIQAYRQLIQAEPDNLITRNKRQAYLELFRLGLLKKDKELIHEMRTTLLANKIDDPEANYYLALAAFEEENLDEAEQYLQKALKLTEEHGPTLLLSGTVSYARRDFEKAAYYLGKYLSRFPDNRAAHKLLGRTYMALGQNKDAHAEFIAALDDKNRDPELIALLGLSEISSGKVQSGIAELEKALQMAPDSQTLKLQLARTYIANQQTGKAIKLLDELIQAGADTYQVQGTKALAYLQAKNNDMAIATAQKLLETSSDKAAALSLMGNIQLATGDETAARRYFEQAIAANPDYIGALINLAQLDERNGELAAAEKHYHAVLEKQPDNIAAINSLARLAARQGDIDKHVKWLETARKTDKKELLARIALVEHYLKTGQIPEAEAIVREIETYYAKEPVFLLIKGELLLAQKRYTQAEAVFNDLTLLAPELDAGFYQLGRTQLVQGNKEEALKNLRKAYSLNKNKLNNVILLATAEQASGNFARAIQLADEVIKALPQAAAGYLIKGDALLASGQTKKAKHNYDKAWSYQQTGDLALRRFRVTRTLSGLDQAVPILDKWLQRNPGDERALLELATAYFVAQRNGEAITYFEKLLKLQPDNSTALNNLAWLYDLENNPKALELAEKAYQLQPESADILDTYGWLLYKHQKAARAVRVLKKAADKLPGHPEVQYHYARALYATGDTETARRIFKHLLASDRPFSGREEAQRLLAQP